MVQAEQSLGLLFGMAKNVFYYDLGKKKHYHLMMGLGPGEFEHHPKCSSSTRPSDPKIVPFDLVYGIVADEDNNKVYVRDSYNIRELLGLKTHFFNDFLHKANGCGTLASIVRHHEKIMAISTEGMLIDVLKRDTLIPYEEPKKRGICCVWSLLSYGERLFALVTYSKNNSYGEDLACNNLGGAKKASLVEINDEMGKYSFGDRVIIYDTNELDFCQAIPVRSAEIGVSVISSAYGNCLDLDGNITKGSKTKRGVIYRVALLGHADDNSEVEVAYADSYINDIIFVKIDVKKNKVVKRKSLFKGGLDHLVGALELVRSKKLHDELIKMATR